jgi:hypothetical protein
MPSRLWVMSVMTACRSQPIAHLKPEPPIVAAHCGCTALSWHITLSSHRYFFWSSTSMTVFTLCENRVRVGVTTDTHFGGLRTSVAMAKSCEGICYRWEWFHRHLGWKKRSKSPTLQVTQASDQQTQTTRPGLTFHSND